MRRPMPRGPEHWDYSRPSPESPYRNNPRFADSFCVERIQQVGAERLGNSDSRVHTLSSQELRMPQDDLTTLSEAIDAAVADELQREQSSTGGEKLGCGPYDFENFVTVIEHELGRLPPMSRQLVLEYLAVQSIFPNPEDARWDWYETAATALWLVTEQLDLELQQLGVTKHQDVWAALPLFDDSCVNEDLVSAQSPESGTMAIAHNAREAYRLLAALGTADSVFDRLGEKQEQSRQVSLRLVRQRLEHYACTMAMVGKPELARRFLQQVFINPRVVDRHIQALDQTPPVADLTPLQALPQVEVAESLPHDAQWTLDQLADSYRQRQQRPELTPRDEAALEIIQDEALQRLLPHTLSLSDDTLHVELERFELSYSHLIEYQIIALRRGVIGPVPPTERQSLPEYDTILNERMAALEHTFDSIRSTLHSKDVLLDERDNLERELAVCESHLVRALEDTQLILLLESSGPLNETQRQIIAVRKKDLANDLTYVIDGLQAVSVSEASIAKLVRIVTAKPDERV